MIVSLILPRVKSVNVWSSVREGDCELIDIVNQIKIHTYPIPLKVLPAA